MGVYYMEYERILSKYQYAELRIDNSANSVISMRDDELTHSVGTSYGVSARVFENGSWGFASGNNEPIEELLKMAQKLALLGKGRIKFDIPKQEKNTIEDKIKITDPEEQVSIILKSSKQMKAEKISSRNITCIDSTNKGEFYNSHGTEILQKTGYSYLSCTCIAKEGNNIQRGGARSSSRNGFDHLKIDSTMTESKEKAIRLLGADAPLKGRFMVVLDPEMTGVLCHEAIGHACEADAIVDKESILRDRIGHQIGNEMVTITDDPTAKDFGNYHYDDEGIKAKKATLVQNGILKEYINSMETAHELGIATNGHARADGYDSSPIVRMSNTYFKPGKSSIEDVFEVRHGIYLKGMRGGSVDIFSGGFMFKAEEAYEIKNSEKGKLMHDVTITGNILETLKNVECVGKDFGTSPGICGKGGQEAPVSDGGPHIRLKDVAVG